MATPQTFRAYATLQVKSLDDEGLIEGVASTASTDRMGDILEPLGATFSLPMPLLWQHKTGEPIGTVISAKATAEGITIRARIARHLLPRIEEAWTLIKAGLVRGLSVGFRPIGEPEPLDPKDPWGGLRFKTWEWLELSAVTIPANMDASIAVIKQLDCPAAPGRSRASLITRPGASGLTRTKDKGMKPYSEQITDMQNARAAKVAAREAVQQKASDEGRGKTDSEREEFDALSGEIETVDKELKDLELLEKSARASAQPVAGGDEGGKVRGAGTGHVIRIADPKLPPGIGMARYVMCRMVAHRENLSVLDVAKAKYPSYAGLHEFILKAATPAGTSTEATWASPLVDTPTLTTDFVEFLRPQTIIGKFGAGNVPSLRRVPFNVKVKSQTTGASASWVGEGKAKPVVKMGFGSATLLHYKIAAIAVITEELARFSTPSAEAQVRDELAAAVIERMDTDFVDPAQAAVAGVNPASITNGLVALTSAGTSADNARTDLINLLSTFVESFYSPTSLVLIMPNTLALALSLMVNSLGQPEFPGLTMNGGVLQGIPVITSQYAANASGGGNLVIAVSASDIYLADDGGVTVDISREASLEMLDAPTGSSAVPTAVSVVSMFQTNSIAIRAERALNWAKRRSNAVVYMDDVNWGAVGSPPETGR